MAGELRFVRLCPFCLTLSSGSLLVCLEGAEAGVVDLRGAVECRGVPFVTLFREAGDLEIEEAS
jgi:hypothetical protein